jgi:UPF0042 nucleotide-binding protein
MTETSAPQASGAAPASGPSSGTGSRRRIVLITGVSGAGMSTALKSLEDLGHEAVDNLPLALLDPLIDQGYQQGRPIAVGIDSRTRDFSPSMLLEHLDALRARPDLDIRLLFIFCDDEVLQRRFTETRRRHPLAIDRPVSDGIRRDKAVLSPLRDQADLMIDTSLLNIHDLRRLLAGHFAPGPSPSLFVFVTSFSFRRGLPREADLVFDVRFLDNPHWNPELRPYTGLDRPVQQAIEMDPDFQPFLDRLTGLLAPLLPRYNQEGKSYLTIAVGCSGGKHRSVYTTERLAEWLRTLDYSVGIHHRDIPKGAEGS